MWLRPLVASVLVGSLFLACGGRTDGVISTSSSSSGSSSGGSSGSSSGASSGSSGSSSGASSGSSGSSSGGSSGSSSGSTVSCVFVDLNTYDQSCDTPSDCAYVTTGEVCDGSCTDCGDSLINTSELPRYESAIASIHPGVCECGAPAPIACVNHQCTTGTFAVDAGAADAGFCEYIDLSTYDQSCKADSDCIDVAGGQLCSGGCACGGSTINVDGQSRYEQEIAPLDLLACPCAAQGVPRCVQGQCTLCGFGPNQPPGCPDGG